VTTTPRDAGYAMPAEWIPHEACWLAWPYNDDWAENLAPARREVAALAREIAASGERARLLVANDACEASAREALDDGDHGVELLRMPYGDIWMRDTGPIFVTNGSGDLAAACFRWNGWGEKYVYAHDDTVGRGIAALLGTRLFASDFVLEGGGIEVDGEGTCLTTRQCLLNPNRNGDVGEEAVERALRAGLGVETILWLDEGLANDHTDGHIDTLARFVAPGVALCMEPTGGDDPNADVLRGIQRDLSAMRDRAGRKLEVVTIPSPGRVLGADGRVLPASYANYYLANEAVIVPTYGVASDERAVRAIGALFPTRRAVGASARAIVTGGGAFHCITQQQPAPKA
jgi:agmatine deiminase